MGYTLTQLELSWGMLRNLKPTWTAEELWLCPIPAIQYHHQPLDECFMPNTSRVAMSREADKRASWRWLLGHILSTLLSKV